MHLEEVIEGLQLHDRIHAHYGIDQTDAAGLSEIVAEEFGNAALDRVVDDASHEIEATRATFGHALPRA